MIFNFIKRQGEKMQHFLIRGGKDDKELYFLEN
jgi:hypothetical protein